MVDDAAPRASIIVVGWNAPDLITSCLHSVVSHVRDVSYEIVVALNEPTPQVVAALESTGIQPKVVHARTNLGYGGASNLAAAVARGEYLVFLNEDAVVHSGWLEALVETADRRLDADAVGSQLLSPDGGLQEAGSVVWSDGSTYTVGAGKMGEARSYNHERRVDFCSGGSLLVRRAAWQRHGGFDAVRYFPAYYEDADLCFKIAAAGGSVWYQPSSKATHVQSASTSPRYKEFLMLRNRARFASRWQSELEQRLPPSLERAALKQAIWTAMGSPLRVLVIDDRFPDGSLGSGHARMFDLISDLHTTGRFHIAFFALDPSVGVGVLDSFGVEVIDDLSAHLMDETNEWDAILISRPHNFRRWAPTLREHWPDAPIVYDAEALWSRRIDREAALTADLARKATLQSESWNMHAMEEEAVQEADTVVCISEYEAETIRGLTDRPVHVHSPTLRTPSPAGADYLQRGLTVGFVPGWLGGSPPNVDGLQWFTRHVLPLVRARVPGARLLVTGANPPEEVLSVASPAVEFVGRVPDLGDFYNAIRVAVVPMRFGAGVKLKTVEALQYGVPTVATLVGAEGVPVTDARSLPATDDPARFAQVVATLLGDRTAWEAQRRRVLGECARWTDSKPEEFWPALLRRVVSERRESRNVTC